MLINSGTSYRTSMSIAAPVNLNATSDYAVDADIQLVKYSGEGISGLGSFGIVVRAAANGGGYGLGHCTSAGIFSCGPSQPAADHVAVVWTAQDPNPSNITAAPFRPMYGSWHHYRVEVKGNALRFVIDNGAVNMTATDNRYLEGGRVGLWSYQCQITVKTLKIAAL
jgi:hypothetical protein